MAATRNPNPSSTAAARSSDVEVGTPARAKRRTEKRRNSATSVAATAEASTYPAALTPTPAPRAKLAALRTSAIAARTSIQRGDPGSSRAGRTTATSPLSSSAHGSVSVKDRSLSIVKGIGLRSWHRRHIRLGRLELSPRPETREGRLREATEQTDDADDHQQERSGRKDRDTPSERNGVAGNQILVGTSRDQEGEQAAGVGEHRLEDREDDRTD